MIRHHLMRIVLSFILVTSIVDHAEHARSRQHQLGWIVKCVQCLYLVISDRHSLYILSSCIEDFSYKSHYASGEKMPSNKGHRQEYSHSNYCIGGRYVQDDSSF